MNAKQLRASILQHAMEGKLVNQKINEEVKVEFLPNNLSIISEEEKNIEIPPNWIWVRLADIIKVSSGKNLTKKQMNEEEPYPVYGGNGICGFYNKFNAEEKTLIIGRVGFYCGSLHLTQGRSWVTDNALITTYNNQIVLVEWLKEALAFINLKGTSQATAQPVISGGKIYPLVLAIPPLEEQKRIVDKIAILKEKIDQYDNLYEQYKFKQIQFPLDLEKSILQYATKGKLVSQVNSEEPASILVEKVKKEKEELVKQKAIKKEKLLAPIDENEIPYQIPDSWEWVRIKDLYYNEGQKKPDQKFCYIDVGCIDNKNGLITDSYNILLPEQAPSRARKIVNKGSVIYSTVRPYLKNIAIIDKTMEYETIASTAFIVMNPIQIDSEYLFYVLRSPYFNSLVESKMVGATYPAINDTNFNKLLIPLPPVEEQKRIVIKIKELFLLVKNLETNVLNTNYPVKELVLEK